MRVARAPRQSSFLLARSALLYHVNGQCRVSDGTPGPHLRRNPDSLHDLLVGRTLGKSAFGVRADAIRALRYMSNGNRYEVLRLRGQSSVGKHLLAEGAPGA